MQKNRSKIRSISTAGLHYRRVLEMPISNFHDRSWAHGATASTTRTVFCWPQKEAWLPHRLPAASVDATLECFVDLHLGLVVGSCGAAVPAFFRHS